MTQARIRIWPDLPKATIHPNIYGHFAEHIGRCTYEGIWVGPKSRIPNEDGLRLDVLAALKQLRAPVIRWPGGCFADDYHWRDGVGPVKDRPTTVNIWWKQSEPNTFGTDEFMRLCRAVGAAPYICVNLGSGSPQEAREWLEYCNFAGDSTLTRMRAANGAKAPYDVTYWGVGNENWGCGGHFTPRSYAHEYTRFATYLRALGGKDIQLIACGCNPIDPHNPRIRHWNHDFCEEMRHTSLLDHISIHRYFHRGTAQGFSDSEFHALFGDLLTMERDIQEADALLSYFYPDKFIGLIIDEWGTWHPAATTENGNEQPSALRDGLFAAAALNLFNRYAHRVTMTNIAQTINVLQCIAATAGAKMHLTPTYHVFDMMRPHMGARLLTQEVESPGFETHPVGLKQKHAVPYLNVSASLSGKKVFLTVVNQSIDQDVEATLELRGASPANISGKVLHAEDPRAVNTYDTPKNVAPKRLKLGEVKKAIVHTFPAHSFTTLTATMA